MDNPCYDMATLPVINLMAILPMINLLLYGNPCYD